jgi:hypothetical protein
MWSTVSGGRAKPAAPPKRAPARETDMSGIPWEWEDDASECDAATADLLTALPKRLTLDGQVHAETCLAAIGAIAGLAAQRALFQQLSEQGDAATLKQIRNGRTRTGIEYFSGEPLNRMLVPAPGAKTGGVWSLMAAGALRAGLRPRNLPDLGEMFAHVAGCLAQDGEGRPSVAEHQPHMTGRETLQIVWPVAMDCFHGRSPDAFPHRPTAIRRWPAIAACVAGELIQEMAAVLHPRAGLIIVMESAIYASKIRPASVYAARPAPAPSLSERLENLSDRIESAETPPRPAEADHGYHPAERNEAEQAEPVFDFPPPHDDGGVRREDEVFAHQLQQSLREHFM